MPRRNRRVSRAVNTSLPRVTPSFHTKAITALPFLCGLIAASIPLWFIKYVLFPSPKRDADEMTTSDQKQQLSLWVRVPYGILCVASVVVIGLWLWLIIEECCFIPSSDVHQNVGRGVTSWAMTILAGAIMGYGMLPLVIVSAIAYGVTSSRPTDSSK